MKKFVNYLQQQAVRQSAKHRASRDSEDGTDNASRSRPRDARLSMAKLKRVNSRPDTDDYETHGSYSMENYLQTYELLITPPEIAAPISVTKYWVIFVHGGAWRDPELGASSFVPACKHLLMSPIYSHTASQIKGYISLDYRLSSHHEYPQDPSTLESFWMRKARHPEHVVDVITAVGYLQEKYGFGDQYVLVGHSCGATMVLQSIMRLEEIESRQISWIPPRAVLGVHGIYDIPALIETFRDVPNYRDSVVGAFGDDERIWDHVSPARGGWLSESGAWGTEGRSLIVIAHSPTDDIVDWHQAELMVQKVQAAWCRSADISEYDRPEARSSVATSTSPDREGNFALIKLTSGHHEVWETGWELARAIAAVLRGLNRLEDGQTVFDDCVYANYSGSYRSKSGQSSS